MNLNQIINLVIRMVMRQVVGKGVNAGINAASKRMNRPESDDPEAKARAAQQSGETAKRARQAARLTRRVGRF